MFQYTTETIINSALDSNGTTSKFIGSESDNYGNKLFKVTRVNNFKTSKVKDGISYKTAAAAAVNEVALVTVSAAANSTIYRLEVELRLANNSNKSDYGRNLLTKGKPLYYEYKSDAGATVTEIAAGLKTLINSQAQQYDNTYIVATNAAGALTLTGNDEYIRIKSATISTVVIADGSETVTLQDTGAVTTPGVEGFGNTAWMLKNIRIPTAEATSTFRINQEERPIAGGTYDQYVIEYQVDRSIGGGMAVGQTVQSKTTHVFYVLSTLSADFTTALETAGITVAPSTGFWLTTTDATNPTLDISESDTCTVSTLGNPNGAVTYVSGTVGTATIVAATGVVTLVGAGTTLITATDSQGTTATITLTVQA